MGEKGSRATFGQRCQSQRRPAHKTQRFRKRMQPIAQHDRTQTQVEDVHEESPTIPLRQQMEGVFDGLFDVQSLMEEVTKVAQNGMGDDANCHNGDEKEQPAKPESKTTSDHFDWKYYGFDGQK